jgi:hypothetical protein
MRLGWCLLVELHHTYGELSLQGPALLPAVRKKLRCILSGRIGTIAALVTRSELTDLRL